MKKWKKRLLNLLRTSKADAELIALEQSYQKHVEDAQFALEEKMDALYKAKDEWPDTSIIGMFCLIDEHGINPTRSDVERFLSKHSTGPEGAKAVHTYFEEMKGEYRAVLEKYGFLQALENEKAAAARRRQAYEKLMESPAKTPAGLQAKINVLHLECERRDSDNSAEHTSMRLMLGVVGSVRRAA